jgi:hypothetical protein
VEIVERNMSLAVMRGQVILPGSKSTSRAKGLHRKLGDPATDQRQEIAVGPHREGEEPTPMMHGNGKSDPAIVAVKPANKAERSAAELVEPRVGTKGNADQPRTRRAQNRVSVSQPPGRIRKATFAVITQGRSRMH